MPGVLVRRQSREDTRGISYEETCGITQLQPRNTRWLAKQQKLRERHGKDSFWMLQRENVSTDTLIMDFYLSELGDNKFL